MLAEDEATLKMLEAFVKKHLSMRNLTRMIKKLLACGPKQLLLRGAGMVFGLEDFIELLEATVYLYEEDAEALDVRLELCEGPRVLNALDLRAPGLRSLDDPKA